MDLILKNVAALGEREETIADIGIADGSIVAMEKGLSGDAETLDMQGRLAVPGFVESHTGARWAVNVGLVSLQQAMTTVPVLQGL